MNRTFILSCYQEHAFFLLEVHNNPKENLFLFIGGEEISSAVRKMFGNFYIAINDVKSKVYSAKLNHIWGGKIIEFGGN